MDLPTNCQFSNPINLGTEELPDFEFQNLNCTTTNDKIILISNGVSETYINKEWNYGELFITLFLFLVILFFISKEIFQFLFTKIIRVERGERFKK